MNEDCKNALKLWEREIQLSKCLLSYEIIDNIVDFDRDENFDNGDTDEICDTCLSEFCFKDLQWKHDCGDDSSNLSLDNVTKRLEVLYV